MGKSKRGNPGKGLKERQIRHGRIDLFWKRLHQICRCLPTERDVATELLSSMGIANKRKPREATELNESLLDEVIVIGVLSPIKSSINGSSSKHIGAISLANNLHSSKSLLYDENESASLI